MAAWYAMLLVMARTLGAMHVAKISRRHGDREYDSYLVRRSIREGRRVRHETIANVSQLPPEAIDALTLALKGVRLVPAGEAFEIVRSRKHGHVEAVLGATQRLGLPRLLDREPSRERDLCLAMIAGRVLEGGSKLACTRQLEACTLGEELGVQGAAHDDLYAAMDWLLERRGRSSSGSRAGTSERVSWRCMTCPAPTLRGAPARWHGLAMTTGRASAGGCRSSTGCCVTATGGRSRSRRSRGR